MFAKNTGFAPQSAGVSINVKAVEIGTAMVSALVSSSTADPDSANNSLDFPVEVIADTILPTVSLTSNDIWITEDDSLSLVAQASDDSGIAKIEFYDGSTLINTFNNSSGSTAFKATYPFDVTVANNGLHSYQAKCL